MIKPVFSLLANAEKIGFFLYGMFFASGIWCVADVSSVSHPSEQTEGFLYLCRSKSQVLPSNCSKLCLKLGEWKSFIDSVGSQGPVLENESMFFTFSSSLFPRCKLIPQISSMCSCDGLGDWTETNAFTMLWISFFERAILYSRCILLIFVSYNLNPVKTAHMCSIYPLQAPIVALFSWICV